MIGKRIREIAMAAAADEAKRATKRLGRLKWNRDDFDTAVWAFNRIWPVESLLDQEEAGEEES